MPLLGNGGIQLAQRTSGTVAGVGKWLFAQQLLPFVHCIKGSVGHIDLAPQFQVWDGVPQRHCHIVNNLGVGRDIFPKIPAIPPCDGSDQVAVFIAQGHGAVSYTHLIFIYPGYRFKVLDGLITNFHLPESTLIRCV